MTDDIYSQKTLNFLKVKIMRETWEDAECDNCLEALYIPDNKTRYVYVFKWGNAYMQLCQTCFITL